MWKLHERKGRPFVFGISVPWRVSLVGGRLSRVGLVAYHVGAESSSAISRIFLPSNHPITLSHLSCVVCCGACRVWFLSLSAKYAQASGASVT